VVEKVFEEVGTRMRMARSNFEWITWIRVKSKVTVKCRTNITTTFQAENLNSFAAARCLRLMIKCDTWRGLMHAESTLMV